VGTQNGCVSMMLHSQISIEA